MRSFGSFSVGSPFFLCLLGSRGVLSYLWSGMLHLFGVCCLLCFFCFLVSLLGLAPWCWLQSPLWGHVDFCSGSMLAGL